MADKHPYVTTIGGLTQTLTHLRKSFPSTLNADVLKKLSVASGNEGPIINTIRFLGLIDDKNTRTELGQTIFTLHEDNEFQKAFADVIKKSYHELFDLYGEETWNLEEIKLIAFFRQHDHTSERVGKDQAKTFKSLAAHAGYSELTPQARPKASSRRTGKPSNAKKSKPEEPGLSGSPVEEKNTSNSILSEKIEKNIGLTVRIEINLPVSNDQETYDRIFKSIREYLLNG